MLLSRVPAQALRFSLAVVLAAGLAAGLAVGPAPGLGGPPAGRHADARPASYDPGRGSTTGDGPGEPARERLLRALGVLHDWDERRASAYASGDVVGLATLYLPQSQAGRRDVRLLRGYAERGLVVRGLRPQTWAAALVRSTPDHVRVRVTERYLSAETVDRRGTVRSLRGTPPRERVVSLVHGPSGWRVGAVSR